MNAIDDAILFKIANYFLKYSLKYKSVAGVDHLKNDWYEYVEYGTNNPLTIFLQRNGFSRETATYIKQNKLDYVVEMQGEILLKKSIMNCKSPSVRKEVEEMVYNAPELFV